MPQRSSAIPRPSMTPAAIISRLRLDPVSFVSELIRSHGEITELPLGPQSLFLLHKPAYIRQILMDGDTFKKRPDKGAEDTYLGQMAGFSPMFADSQMPGYARLMIDASERAGDRWRDALPADGTLDIDIYREMMRISLEIVGQTLFQADLQDQAAELVDAILNLDSGYGFDPLTANLGHLLPPGRPRVNEDHDAARRRLQGMMRRLFQNAKASAAPPPLIAALLEHVGNEHSPGVAVGTLLAMHEVTVTTLTWTWYLLSQYPDIERELHAEWARVLGGRPPEFDDVPRLVYTDMVLREVRRLFPSVWMILRFVREDARFGEHEVPAGSVAMASAQIMHRDAQYFHEPYLFNPQRWSAEESAGLLPGAYFPFSEGARACAGETFAKIQDVIILATLGQHWRAELIPGQQFRPQVHKSNAPRPGIEMMLQRHGADDAASAPTSHHAWPRIHA